MYASGVAYGIHVAGEGTCDDAYFMQAFTSENLMNVDIVHAS